jgi:predicted site-specific integrase-resolvase
MGVRYATAWRWFRDGTFQWRRIGPRAIISTVGQQTPTVAGRQGVAIYARVSSSENKRTLSNQAERLVA